MHAVAFNVLRTAQRPILRSACRIIAGVRHPLPYRTFYNTPTRLQTPETPARTGNEAEDVPAEEQQIDAEETEDVGVASSKNKEKTLNAFRQRRDNKSSGRVRGSQTRQPEGLPPVVIPEWFLRKNVKCIGDPAQSGKVACFVKPSELLEKHAQAVLDKEFPMKTEKLDEEEEKREKDNNRHIFEAAASELVWTNDAKYSIQADVYAEIYTTIRASLRLRPPKSTNSPLLRPVPILQCPRDGGIYFLDSVVEAVASQIDADLIRLDAQDIAEIVGPYADENLAWGTSNTSLLGYDAHRLAGRMEDYEKDATSQEENEIEEEESDAHESSRGVKPTNSSFSLLPPGQSKIFNSLFNNIKAATQTKSTGIVGMDVFPMIVPQSSVQTQSQSQSNVEVDPWRELKITTALESILATADTKRASTQQEGSKAIDEPKDLIIQVRDYKELNSTSEGVELLKKLRAVINKKWVEGRNITCIGTTASEHGESALMRSEIQYMQGDVVGGEKRTIFVPLDRAEAQEDTLESDDKARTRQINIRHVEDMIRKFTAGTPELGFTVDIEKDLDSAAIYSIGLDDAVWAYPKVFRLATTIIGTEPPGSTIDGPTFGRAMLILTESDEAKFRWGAEELKSEDVEVENMVADIAKSGVSAKKEMRDKIKQIRKTCNSHEKKLLGGVIVPSDIKTTFDNIRAPKETIEALKTLTSLSLIRPEAFSYGVLATDKIPGLLLYGPPGTGKTMLAKAVAKESGATVLEVSGAEVNDMFVGEAEKNVKAVFSLAKKLSPCIVFIDEADAIFAARGESKQRSSHRELINQFLREWDGMNDMSAFIMLATNRPFDLDEAVLRRLPRRLLVDLPVEKDREAILKIHLRDEILDESVSLSKIAHNTPFYSGSDLKNISVAAALACIREENAVAAKHTGDEPYVYPEKRILTKPHFDKALDEISASVSEDMSTLTAIRKFDEKYGDRKGRRKKGAALGFGGTHTVEKDSEAARVRKLDV